eukprot:Nk52_evm1s409 gene=Nk52_evmTU1s409
MSTNCAELFAESHVTNPHSLKLQAVCAWKNVNLQLVTGLDSLAVHSRTVSRMAFRVDNLTNQAVYYRAPSSFVDAAGPEQGGAGKKCNSNDGKVILTSPAAIMEHIFKGKLHSSRMSLHKWLIFDGEVLLPLLVRLMAAKKEEQEVKKALLDVFRELMYPCLKENEGFLCSSGHPSIDDVFVWSSIYFVAGSGKNFFDHSAIKSLLFGNGGASVLGGGGGDMEAMRVSFNKWYDTISGLEGLSTFIDHFKKSLLAKHKDVLSSTAQRLYSIMPKNSRVSELVARAVAAAQTQKPPKHQAKKSTAGAAASGSQGPNEEVAIPKASLEEVQAAMKRVGMGKTRDVLVQGGKTLLPESGKRNVLITSALPYVNNVPHLGNIIGCVLSADVYARFCRLRGYNALYISGTDEYGTATETKAIQEGVTPQQICDKYHAIHKQVYDWFQCSFDLFGRTTTHNQTEICQDIFKKLEKNGFVREDVVEQLRCQSCEMFLADRFVEGTCPHPGCGYEDARGDQCDLCGKLVNATELKNPRCKQCGQPPVVMESKHLFLDLETIQPDLEKFIAESSKKGSWSSNSTTITNSWLRDGLKPRCITRDLKWGTPVPTKGFQDKVFYVWFDAPIGYISMTKTYTSEWEKWWKNNDQVELYQFMAKDNVPFHTVIFPSSLIATNDNYTLLNHLNATEYLNYEGGKFSKSRGVGVFGNQVMETEIPSDIWRFYLLYVRPEGADTAFSWSDLVLKNNSELLNNLGNFINRGLTFCKNNFGCVIPSIKYSAVDPDATLTDFCKLDNPSADYECMNSDDANFIAVINRHFKEYVTGLEAVKLRDGIRCVLAISRVGNQYLQGQAPWKVLKAASKCEDAAVKDKLNKRAGVVIALACNVVALLSSMMEPYMPTAAKTIRSQLNIKEMEKPSIEERFYIALKPGHKIGQPAPLFERIDPEYGAKCREKFGGETQGDKKECTMTVEELTKAVSDQGNAVRKLKGDKAEKSVIDTNVKKLLELKELLKKATEKASAPVSVASKKGSDAEIAKALADVTEQGNLVRKLKGEKAEKSVVDAAVAKLLSLKSIHATLSGEPLPSSGKSGKKKK